MPTNRVDELLYDSAAALRLVDKELDELRTVAPDGALSTGGARCACGAAIVGGPDSTESALVGVPEVLRRANEEISKMLTQLRSNRVALEEATADRLQQTHDKIREVTSATEVAATGILDGLDRAHLLLDELDTDARSVPTVRGAELRQQLRDEVFALMGHMQFQDITTQQLNYAGSILLDLEQRLGDVQQLFEPGAATGVPRDGTSVPSASRAATIDQADRVIYAPDASLDQPELRQALADRIFTGRK